MDALQAASREQLLEVPEAGNNSRRKYWLMVQQSKAY